MTLDPKAIEQTEFSTSFRGYDKSEVRTFLRRVAGELDGLQGELRRRAIADTEAAATARAELDGSTPASNGESEAKPTDSDVSDAGDETTLFAGFDRRAPSSDNMEDDGRFQALGDRIGDLLKSAHESATHLSDAAQADAEEKIGAAMAEAAVIRGEAETEARQIREVAYTEAEQTLLSSEAEAKSKRSEAEELQVAAQAATAEAEALKTTAAEQGAEELRAKQEELEALSAAAANDRDAAMSTLADARGQVTELLGQARSQSEFIRHEAEEVIRARVRRNMDQAEERLNILRNSEIASRERIVAAHRELEGAMARLDVEQSPTLPENPEQYALEGAQRRADASNYGEIESDYREADEETDVAHGDPLVAEAQSAVLDTGDGSSGQSPQSDESPDAGEAAETQPSAGDTVGVDSASKAVKQSQPIEAEQAEAQVIDVSSTTTSEAVVLDTADAIADLSGTVVKPSEARPDEDALGRLVREAMERAVDSARSSEG